MEQLYLYITLDERPYLFQGLDRGSEVLEPRRGKNPGRHSSDAVRKLRPGDKLVFTDELEYWLIQPVTVEHMDTPETLAQRAYNLRVERDPAVSINDCNLVDGTVELEES